MKKSLLAFLLIVSIVFSLHAQTVNGIPIKDIDVEYIQIVGTSKLLSTKVTIDIDFGQRDKAFVFKDTEIRDEANKPIAFNSMIDALNFMTSHGYEFVQAYAYATSSNQSVYHYLLRKSNKRRE